MTPGQHGNSLYTQLLLMMVRDMGMTYEKAIAMVFADTNVNLTRTAAVFFRDRWGSEEDLRVQRRG